MDTFPLPAPHQVPIYIVEIRVGKSSMATFYSLFMPSVLKYHSDMLCWKSFLLILLDIQWTPSIVSFITTLIISPAYFMWKLYYFSLFSQQIFYFLLLLLFCVIFLFAFFFFFLRDGPNFTINWTFTFFYHILHMITSSLSIIYI